MQEVQVHGKSEFIITYILSLAINFHPYDVSMVLIDYKGGGLAGAFSKGTYKLPHLVGTITNIDEANLQRSLASIKSELKRRQRKFNDAREKTDGGTIDIYKYQRLYHQGVVSEPIPHLLIISDEFAELKQQQPDFMDELISVARIGRSLGVHLILATQKPAGIVNDQIRSNSKFAVCLKVQDKSDSMDVIGRPDAADLRRAGQFYLKVGNNEYFVLGQAAWAGALYYPSDITRKKVDTSIKIISNIGRVIKEVDDTKKEKHAKQGDQLTNIVKYLDTVAKNHDIASTQLWLDDIPADIYLDDIRKKYRILPEKNNISALVGEYDDPDNQRQGPVVLDFNQGENYIVYGNAQSGKETLISTLVYDLIVNHDSQELQLYMFDFGSETLKIFKDAPQVGDVTFLSEKEKIDRFFALIQKEIRNRVEVLSNYSGGYNQYIKQNKGNSMQMPMIIVIFNGVEAMSEYYEDRYDDIFLNVTREGPKAGIIFIVAVSTQTSLRYRTEQNFKQRIALQMNSDNNYYGVWDAIGKKRPSNIFGRGLTKIGSEIYEFQTCKVVEPELFNETIKLKIQDLRAFNTSFVPEIPTLPNKVLPSNIITNDMSIQKLPIGIEKDSLKICKYNFKKNIVNIISGKNIDVIGAFAINVVNLLRQTNNVHVEVFDSEDILGIGKSEVVSLYTNTILAIQNKVFLGSQMVCVIVDFEKFIQKIDNKFDSLIKLAEQTGTVSVIICDTANRIKNHEFEPWFRQLVSKDNGIWVGPGIGDQYLFNIALSLTERKEGNEKSFGYVISQGEGVKVKLVGLDEET